MKKTISIIGSGPSSLLLAAFLDVKKFDITIYEKNKTAGRKLLVAGKGGFNLTHSEPITEFIKRYTPSDFLENSILNFTNDDFRNWLHIIGVPTFIGSSKRVYPKEGIKPITVLNTILNHIKEKGIIFKYEHTFSGWDTQNNLIINDKTITSNYTVFSLGGASWKVTSSDGSWLEKFQKKEVKTIPFQASNCAFKVDWKSDFINQNEGNPLKNIAIYCSEKKQKGEAVITKFGLEGNAIYGLSPQIREQLKSQEKAIIYIDFKPTLTLENLTTKILNSTFKNTTQVLKKELKLSNSQIDLLKTHLTKEAYLDSKLLSENIKKFPLEIIDLGVLDEAISTVGGIDLNAVDSNFQLDKIKNQYCIGEMLNWDAPTGGYLIQACASSGVYLANHLNKIK
ncbi:aminoacetone oxidase family FAD-binding enzyme [Polaribacter sp. Hel1_85]|uniref:aminoacetone oxidase family FAD-binding enzyme n=1 Tax=Polaribacter sp. Hel1_85 TaxID=1250005 RepID=UPI00052D6987|nr:aminoacetone oxidase family FAD-binding enzyme [Polaribacter sp. Hel1_85]KGL63961.1 NAD(FAD)-utilizing dehydrogenase [Polaribacter sp. Hel1_85]